MPQLDSNVRPIVNQTIAPIGISPIRYFAQIPDLIKLTLGEPDFNVPEHVKQAAITSIVDNKSHYAPQKGILPLRTAISSYLKQRFDVNYDPKTEVLVTVGATEAIFVALGAMLNPGDKVLIPTPTFSLYMAVVKLFGAIPVEIDTTEDGFRLTGKRLQAVIDREGPNQVKALILNFPGNPTGFEYTRAQLEELAAVVEQHAMYVLTDEIYAELTYGQPHVSMAELLPGRSILVNGLSKSHAMTGYRVGYFVGPADFIANATKLHGFAVTSVSNPAQYAALEALTTGLADAQPMQEAYEKRRDFVVAKLNELGYETLTPAGAFYTFSKIPAAFHLSSVAFAEKLAEDGKVGVTPGNCFGASGEGYFRISYAASMADIQTAMQRLAVFTEKLTQRV
ncbi:aminotransferase class I/II-fold pyridoxal phosphate-dependent enzyme [Levilactobacillus suantsaii]|uniref:Aminotransferase n=1 Tax=Levilactobacillus suantsaii TaxID=2292255 RepID=A0A4Q0VH19_9LACO|nr:aminotransferase class I/II-fold pyridoxal phosphate-dependent enzyme [Levilactobacillus suantsaii]QMU09127.1 aminotransferase class I/II-fold pyridoxal phosphate-dependent enzyme [Levilactobacillus suantsaii]RXI78371.1 aminotransferase class I/II-fold pyridoxal phosphate-dependent enzyme [Levilactobacillus suantsaii]